MGQKRLARKTLSAISHPVLVANGDNDIMVPTINSVALFQALPNAELSIFPDAGHGGIFQYHREFTEQALRFFGKLTYTKRSSRGYERPFRFAGIPIAGIHFDFATRPYAEGRRTGSEAVMSVVLVTGGSGFIASYCILQLLAAGHQVRTTVRSLKRESDVRAMLKQGGAEPGDRLKFFAAELEQDAGWREAVTGCDYVLHVASPLSQHVPKNEDEMIVPARDGTLRVLRAARDAGVKRVVLTSSFAAIGYGHPPQQAPFDETRLD